MFGFIVSGLIVETGQANMKSDSTISKKSNKLEKNRDQFWTVHDELSKDVLMATLSNDYVCTWFALVTEKQH